MKQKWDFFSNFFSHLRISKLKQTRLVHHLYFVHPIFSSFHFLVFWSLQLRDFLSVFFCLAHLALQNVNKDYVIFLYFRNFFAKSDQKQKMKNGMNETEATLRIILTPLWCPWMEYANFPNQSLHIWKQKVAQAIYPHQKMLNRK